MELNNTKSKFNVISAFTSDPKYDFAVYAKGYYNAAKILADNFLSKPGYRDYDGYPIVFLYRHSLELNLKNIIYWGQRLSNFNDNNTFDNKMYNYHDLKILSDIGAKLLLRIFNDDTELKEACEKIISISEQYSELDKDSYSYRYPIDKYGIYSTNKHQTTNIKSIYLTMKEIQATFEAINLGLDMKTNETFNLIDILEQFILN